MFRKLCLFSSAIAVLFVLTGQVLADPPVLTFEGVGNNRDVGDFYNSGAGGHLGIIFENARALVDLDAGGSGGFGGEPSPSTAIFPCCNTPASAGKIVMNVFGAFGASVSGFYTSPGTTSDVRVYEGFNGTGTLLASTTLPLSPHNGAPDPTGSFSPFVPFSLSFSGIARSVVFEAGPGNLLLDNITLGTETPIPAPGIGINYWSSIASAGTVDDDNLAVVALTDPYAMIKSSAPVPSTGTIRYRIAPVDGLFSDSCKALRVRFRDEGAGARVQVFLKRMDINTGLVNTLLTFNSDGYSSGAEYQTQVSTCVNLRFDFDTNVYWIEAIIARGMNNGVPTNPGLAAIQIIHFGE